MTAVQDLRELMPPTGESDTTVDWDRMAESWSVRFPEDYREFIDVYGAGTIEDYVSVLKPELWGADPEPDGGMLTETANARRVWGGEGKSPELAGATPTLIAWGVDGSSDILCWDASDRDPGRWPVLVRNRDDNLWRRYECGMGEFLVRMLRAELPSCPLGDVGMWGSGSAKFLNHREFQRLRNEGLDPWTGELDPYAGMFDE